MMLAKVLLAQACGVAVALALYGLWRLGRWAWRATGEMDAYRLPGPYVRRGGPNEPDEPAEGGGR